MRRSSVGDQTSRPKASEQRVKKKQKVIICVETVLAAGKEPLRPHGHDINSSQWLENHSQVESDLALPEFLLGMRKRIALSKLIASGC